MPGTLTCVPGSNPCSSSEARAKTHLVPGPAILGRDELVLIIGVFQHKGIRKVNAFGEDCEILVDVIGRARIQLVTGSDLRNGLSGAVERRRRELLKEVMAPIARLWSLKRALIVEQHGIGRV